uniref:Dimer_Tnp_hAT domain-containing protein n=1 Tax=Heterorhabditis bacteriophora TaxID=37862 RepID=A0A1I7W6U7_HETBA
MLFLVFNVNWRVCESTKIKTWRLLEKNSKKTLIKAKEISREYEDSIDDNTIRVCIYLSRKNPVYIDSNPLEFWSKSQLVLPKLARLARRTFSLVPTSIASEHLFSKQKSYFFCKLCFTPLLPGAVHFRWIHMNSLPVDVYCFVKRFSNWIFQDMYLNITLYISN